MNILFFTSGFIGVNKVFEDSIIQSLKTKGCKCEVFTEHKNLAAFRHQIESFQPDLILVMGGFTISVPLLTCIKQSNIKSAIWMTEDPYYIDFTLPLSTYFTYIFTIDLGAIAEYKKFGASHVFHLPLGTDPHLYHPKLLPDLDNFDICLVGFPYTNRIELIKFILQESDYRILLVGSGWETHLMKWRKWKHLFIINQRIEPAIVVDYYNRSKINLNIHRPADEKFNRNSKRITGKSINNRTFDLACCEAFQLTDFREDLSIHFEIGKEIATFQNKEDLINKINYYLVHKEERKQMAQNARKRVLSSHTFEHRVMEILNKVQS